MAEDLVRQEPAAAPEATAVEPAVVPEPGVGEPSAPLIERPPAVGRRRLYRGRFALAYLGLALAAGAAAGATLWLLDRPAESRGAAWSAWEPTGHASSYPRQIADHVARQYRHPSGNQLVAVTTAGRAAVPTEEGELPVRAAVIQNDPQGDREDVSVVSIDDDVMYVFCGGGQQCSMREGEPSVERGVLLRREALEMALYTFKYTDADAVITLMPPRLQLSQTGGPQTITSALFLQEKDFRRQLERPLQETLVRAVAPKASELNARETALINGLTVPHMFRYQFTQAQEGSAVILLAPFDA